MSNAVTAQPVFPVLCLAQDGSISVADSAERLRRCSAVAFFRNRYFDDLVVIDSAASRFRVVRASLAAPLSPVGRWTARMLNRPIHAELQLEVLGPGSLDDARKILNEWLDRDPGFWEASRDIEEWKGMIARAKSARALVRLFV